MESPGVTVVRRARDSEREAWGHACVENQLWVHAQAYLSVLRLLVNLIFFVFIYVFPKISGGMSYFVIG